MSKPWHPNNWEEACKRNAGRKKLHQRKRKERADRIVRLLAAIEAAPELLESSYGWLSLTAETMKRSKATASRDFQLARRIHYQFARMFGRRLEVKKDQILWSWDWSHYGFRTRESVLAEHKKPVGHFPFNTRATVTEDAYCGFNTASWQPKPVQPKLPSANDLIRLLRSFGRLQAGK
jgi:hypothetical protein